MIILAPIVTLIEICLFLLVVDEEHLTLAALGCLNVPEFEILVEELCIGRRLRSTVDSIGCSLLLLRCLYHLLC
jgi:hypothetical protein